MINYEYVITEEELRQKGLNLSDYALDETFIPALIQVALDICVSRVCFLDDTLTGENSLNNYLGLDTNIKSVDKVNAFKKLQYRVLYNLIFTAEESPIDNYVDTIIVHEMGCGKINGFQKGLHYKNN